MGDLKGFLKIKRESLQCRPVCERVKDFGEVTGRRPEKLSEEQGARCMDCGTPFCHWGCPVGNYIPEWNDLMFNGRWEKAFELLAATNNLPEVTGRVCPAPCEYACVLGINDDPVTVRDNELDIVEYAFRSGLVRNDGRKRRTGKKVAIIGSGPSGIACADQLNKAGHDVTVFERDDKIGGILRYGIPNFKLEKRIIDRRVELLKKAGIKFMTGIEAGIDLKAAQLKKEFDAICLACGSRVPRDLEIEGRGLGGIHFAMDYLTQSNRRTSGESIAPDKIIDAKDKDVLIIGGGDTGADCVGTSHRQGAKCVVQIEILPKPPECRTDQCPWPKYPNLFKTSSSHEEGGERHWSISATRFVGSEGRVRKVSCVRNDSGEKFNIKADLVILAIGFLHPEHTGLVKELGLKLDAKGNIATGSDYMASVNKIFSAGDMRRGQSLIVWAIAEGRRAAYHIDKYLIGKTGLPMI